jgi:nitroimidazol reductase NimA-like FMN-containing flavoprotein (pyridoxamine 5'-phosphate oxidase superfamily)
MRAVDLLGGTEILSETDCWQLLETEVIGRVVANVDGQIEIFPVNYAVDGEGIVFRTNAGRKTTGVLAGETVFEVDSVDRQAKAGWSVIVRGDARDITSFDGPTRAGAVMPWTGPKDFLMRIRARTISGRRVIPLESG